MKDKLPKPIKAEASVCPRCGFTSENEGHVRLCIRNHIQPRDLKIKGAVPREGSQRVYSEGERFPTVIEVWCHQSQRVVRYKLVPTSVKNPFTDTQGKKGPVIA